MQAGPPLSRWSLFAAALVAFGVLVYLLRAVLTPVFFAFLLAYILNPAVDRLETRRIPRTAAIALLLAGALGAIAVFVVMVLPAMVSDIASLVRELPAAARRAQELAAPALARLGVELPSTSDELLVGAQKHLASLPTGGSAVAGAAVQAILGGTASFFNALASAIMVPILSFYLLNDFHSLAAGFRELLPHGSRDRVVDIFSEVDQVLGQFVRGQILVMAILALLYAVAYSVIGVRLAVPIGIVAGLISFIPYVGGAAAFGLATLMVLLHWTGWWQLIAVVVAYGVIQMLEGFVITPRVVGDKLGLAPIWVLIGLMAGGNLFGFTGILLALPATAVAKVLVMRGIRFYKQSGVYRGGPGDPGDSAPETAGQSDGGSPNDTGGEKGDGASGDGEVTA